MPEDRVTVYTLEFVFMHGYIDSFKHDMIIYIYGRLIIYLYLYRGPLKDDGCLDNVFLSGCHFFRCYDRFLLVYSKGA